MKAEDVVARTREQLSTVDAAIRNHPYLAALRAGEVPLEAIKALPGHQHHMAISDMRSIATMVARFGDTPHVDLFNGILQGQLGEREKILVLAKRLGMTKADLDAYEVEPEGYAYAAYMAWLAQRGSAAEVMCGLFVNFQAWGANCADVGEALRDAYGFTSDDTVFLDSFIKMPSIEATALAIIQDGLDHGVSDVLIMRAARLIQGYERMFWDTMMRIADQHR